MSEAILLRVKIKSDKTERVIGLLPKVRRQLDSSGVIATISRRIFERILMIEGLYTESLFLEQTDGGTFVLWYMEAEDMSQVYEGYEAALKSHHPVAIVAQKSCRRLLKRLRKLFPIPGMRKISNCSYTAQIQSGHREYQSYQSEWVGGLAG
jgi:hypothetical protein